MRSELVLNRSLLFWLEDDSFGRLQCDSGLGRLYGLDLYSGVLTNV